MTKKEEFGLDFNKIFVNGQYVFECRRKDGIVDDYNYLQFISCLDIESTQFLLGDITDTIVSQNPVREYTQPSGLCDDIDLELAYPNFIIEDLFSIPLVDMKILLEEWLDFIQIFF